MSSLQISDRELVRRLLAGDERAFDLFFSVYFPRLYRFTLIRLGDDPDAARDVVQQALCKAVRGLDTWRGEASLFTWMCQICRNELAGYFRKLGREREHIVLLEDHPEIRAALESTDAPSASDPLAGFRRAELARLVQATLDHLPHRYGDALEWKYIEGLTVEEIAARLGTTATAAQSLLARARRAFRDTFGPVMSSLRDTDIATIENDTGELTQP
ncbi:MAG: RNA polymerase sigma factor [Gammaproteobacteria bacterium]|nr:RNA polymerase sigma factor [Gammaproteobacteria bacterium]